MNIKHHRNCENADTDLIAIRWHEGCRFYVRFRCPLCFADTPPFREL